MVVERGQIWSADLGEPEGSEPGYNPLVLIIQSDAFNRSRLRTVIAVVLTTNLRLVDAPGNVLIPAKASGLRKDSVANVSQVITIDREFLLERAGRVRGQFLKDLENGLRSFLACSFNPSRGDSIARERLHCSRRLQPVLDR
ncbi:MAG: type II toxin-antitoxin system PemK/MazF family toxin [Vicinamibacterales bacterium]